MFKKNRLFFKPDDGGNTGGSGEDDKQNSSQDANKGKGEGDKDTKPMTQAQLDAIASEARKSARSKAVTETLEALGVKDIDEAKKLLKEADDLKKSQLSEQEKQALALKTAQDEAATARLEKEAALKLASDRALKSEILIVAQGLNFRPEAIQDVYLVVDRTKITEKDGAFTGIKEAVEAVAKAKPFWLGQQKNQGGTPLPRNGNGQQNQNQGQNDQRVRTITRL